MTTQLILKRNSVWVALTVVQILFGINYIASKIIVGSFPPLVWASIRVVISAVALFVIAGLSGTESPPLSRPFFRSLVVYSLLGIVINQGSFLVGLRYTTATNSAVLNTLIPIFTLLFVTLSGKEAMKAKRAVGFLFALVGVLVIRKVENFSLSDDTFLGDSLTVLNCLSYGLFLTVSKKFFQNHDPLWATAWLFAFGSIGLTAIAAPSWATFQWPEFTPQLVGCMVFSILGSTLLAYFLNLWALARAKSSSVALFINLQPVVASLLAWGYFGEEISLRTMLSSLLIFAGMMLALFQ